MGAIVHLGVASSKQTCLARGNDLVNNMTGRDSSKGRYDSGVRSVSAHAALIQRRVQLASDGCEAGRWCTALYDAVQEIATRSDLPRDEESWCAYLDVLECALGPDRRSGTMAAWAPDQKKRDGTG